MSLKNMPSNQVGLDLQTVEKLKVIVYANSGMSGITDP